jgi:hypothetical protein
MNSVKGHGKLGSKQWDINQILGFEDVSDLIQYVSDRFKVLLDDRFSHHELIQEAIEIAEAHHDNSGRIDT